MAAADLVITSSGDTCSEARAVGRPLLLLDVVPGHGRDNLQHELELGDAVGDLGPAGRGRARRAGRADRVKPAAEGLGPPTAAAQHRAAWESSFSTLLAALGLDDRFR